MILKTTVLSWWNSKKKKEAQLCSSWTKRSSLSVALTTSVAVRFNVLHVSNSTVVVSVITMKKMITVWIANRSQPFVVVRVIKSNHMQLVVLIVTICFAHRLVRSVSSCVVLDRTPNPHITVTSVEFVESVLPRTTNIVTIVDDVFTSKPFNTIDAVEWEKMNVVRSVSVRS